MSCINIDIHIHYKLDVNESFWHVLSAAARHVKVGIIQGFFSLSSFQQVYGLTLVLPC